MSKYCEMCGSTNQVFLRKKFGKSLCAKCYRYETNHPVNPLPEKGEVALDEQNRLICHICGRAFKKLGSHAINGHGITAYEYKKMFELNNNTGLLIESSKEKLRQNIKDNYEVVVKQNLLENGSKTRFKKGSKGRPKDMVRLQCRKVLVRNFFPQKEDSNC